MPTTDVHLEFPDDRTRDDFEVAFRGWLKQYQQRAAVALIVSTQTVRGASAAGLGWGPPFDPSAWQHLLEDLPRGQQDSAGGGATTYLNMLTTW